MWPTPAFDSSAHARRRAERCAFPGSARNHGHDDGSLYVADRLNHSIRMIEAGADEEVTTLAGTDEPGAVSDNGADARFDEPAFLV